MNPIGWIEIPVLNMNRAKEFYEYVFEFEITLADLGELLMGWFPSNHEDPGCSGSLVFHKDAYIPSRTDGPLVYFSCGDVSEVLQRVKIKNGKILVAKKLISPDVGYMGMFLDSEGNRIALHSRK